MKPNDVAYANVCDDADIVIDYCIYVCVDCSSERKHVFEKPLHNVEEVRAFINQEHAPCECGSGRCDIQMHMQKLS